MFFSRRNKTASELPNFQYHPNPLETGSIKQSKSKCECCGKSNGFIYTASLYCSEEIEFICPWCIKSGKAADKFQGIFIDDYPLINAGISFDVIAEVTKRTPGFPSWQQEQWMTHCNDACEYHGDVSKKELASLSSNDLQNTDLNLDFLEKIKAVYQPGGSPAIYVWVCRHCRKRQYQADYS